MTYVSIRVSLVSEHTLKDLVLTKQMSQSDELNKYKLKEY